MCMASFLFDFASIAGVELFQSSWIELHSEIVFVQYNLELLYPIIYTNTSM